MNKKMQTLLTIILFITMSFANADDNIMPTNKTETISKKNVEKTIQFNFTDENLVDVINQLAAEKDANIVLPMGVNAITSKLTLHVEEKMTLDKAWTLLYTILDVAGYSLISKANNMFIIVKNSKLITKEPLPIYINISPEKLPDSDKRIRYLYYLSNIKLSEAGENELITAIREILPDTATYKIDQATNAILLNDKANNIRSVMHILTRLDQTGFHEIPKFIKLRYASAPIVANLFNEVLKPADDIHRYRLDTRKLNEATYFSRHIKIIAEERLNILIVLGRPQAVNRVEEFIHKYIDVELDSGKSILHVHQLQYLDASTFEPILQRIVESTRPGGTGQARALVPTERIFDGVIIKADKPQGAAEDTSFGGSNKLIIAARNKDWNRIKELIEQLDKPQPQVILEILVADLTIEDNRILGALTRNPQNIPLPNDVNLQTAQISSVIVDNLDNPTTIAADLLKKSFKDDGEPATTEADATKSVAGILTPGSSILAMNDKDGKTWGILQALKLFEHKKVISNPHVIAVNNKEAIVTIGEERFVQDEGVGSPGGATTSKKKWVKANLKITIKPRISSKANVNLTVEVDIVDFVSGTLTDANRVSRNVVTNANVGSGDILALGGLIRIDTENGASETPILGNIPILGYLFKKRTGKTNKTNLTVFISPTIIEPKLRGGISEYTKEYINLSKKYANEGMLFETLKEPITRWFFGTDIDANEAVDEFLQKDELYKKGQSINNVKQIPVSTNEQNEPKRTVDIADNSKKKQGIKLKQLLEKEENPFLAKN